MELGLKAGRGALLAVVLASAGATAQTPPPAREVVQRHVEAIGGEAVLRRESSWKTTGTFSMPASGLSGTIEAYQADGKSFGRITVPGIGDLLRGFDGKVGWSLNPLEGPRLLEGPELAQAREEARRGAALRDTSVVASLDMVGRADMNGEACWKVRVTWKSGRETHDCYSVASGLLIATTGTAVTPMGQFEYTTLLNDYRKFGNVRVPTRVVQQSLGQEQIVTTESIDFGGVDASRFALPAEIRALVR